MKITVKATNLDLTPSLKIYIEQKLGILRKFVKRFDLEDAVEMRIEVARTTRHHQKGEVFMAEANLRLPKQMVRGVERAKDVRTAIGMLRDTLRREINKYRTRMDRRPTKKGRGE
jgi:ribosomal subunit interface protein